MCEERFKETEIVQVLKVVEGGRQVKEWQAIRFHQQQAFCLPDIELFKG